MFRVLAVLSVLGCVSANLPLVLLQDEPSNVTGDQRIILGENANEGEFPFIVSLRKRNSSPGHSCGGSILTSRWVLTASHCCAPIKNKASFYIYTGSIYLSRGGSSHAIENIIMHESYQQALNFRNDICLIKVSDPFPLGSKVQQVKLTPQGWPVEGNEKVVAAGWGLTSPNSQTPPDRLQKGTNFVTLTNSECGRVTGVSMFPGYLCILGRPSGLSVWKGDSGGPLLKDGAQVGLTSFGFFPYGNGKPNVFCRVPNYINWIKQKLGPDVSQLKFS